MRKQQIIHEIVKGDTTMKGKRIISLVLTCAILVATLSMYVSATSGSFNLSPIGSYSTKNIVSFYLSYEGCCGGSVTTNPNNKALKFVLLRSGASYKTMPYWASQPTYSWASLKHGYTYTLSLKADANEVPGVSGTYYYY